jgi:hypothetical protein
MISLLKLPPEAIHAFKILQQQLMSEPVMAFPQADRQYALITDAATGTADSRGGLGAILTQKDAPGNQYAISFASQQLKDHEKNYYHQLLKKEGPKNIPTFHFCHFLCISFSFSLVLHNSCVCISCN